MQNSDLMQLTGFDTKTALELLNNNLKLYKSILIRFREQYVASLPQLTETLLSGNTEDIKREAHTLKGLAGTIGCKALKEAAIALENDCKEGLGSARQDLAKALLQELEQTIQILHVVFPD